MRTRSESAFTLIELLIVIVIATILVMIATPSFIDTLDRRRVINATQVLIGQIQQARSVAIVRNEEISIVLSGSGEDWCFGLTDGATCDCTEIDPSATGACTVGIPEPGATDRFLVRTGSENYPGISFSSAVSPVVLTFEPTRGVRVDASAATSSFQFQSPRDLTTRVDVNIIGRVSACSPSNQTLLGGIKPC